MLAFINAKINIGLQIVRRREDGYHDLQTLFYPIGLHAGTPLNRVQFCDLLEITPKESGGFSFVSDCPYPPESNLVAKAARLFYETFGETTGAGIRLEKHIPDGAGIGGGSADAAFTLRMLNELAGRPADESRLLSMALSLGADCPFFILNRPAYAEGVGERLQPVRLDLSGKWLLLVKPDVRISTREAFALVTPKPSDFDLRGLAGLPVPEWRDVVHNDFEDSVFPQFPALANIKALLYESGAQYASLTGSGSCLYGIYETGEEARAAVGSFESDPTILTTYLLLL